MKTGLSRQELERGVRLVQAADRMSRREFIRLLGGSAGGVLVGGSLVSCGGNDGTAPGQSTAAKGRIEGTVVDSQGTPQPSLGRIFLIYSSGKMTGRYVDVDPAGRFAFADVDPGDWQIRFDAPRVAEVDEGQGAENPLRLTIEAGRTTAIRIPIVRVASDDTEIEIYIGDYMFYEVPFGAEGGTATVKLGTSVCWYNVGLQVHNVTGGPWITSGDLNRADNFIWKADTIGTFPYRCTHHQPQMTATLVVTA